MARRVAAAGSASALRCAAGDELHDHPHGGGEGKSSAATSVTPWGVPTLGKRTRAKHKESDKLIVGGRRRGKDKR